VESIGGDWPGCLATARGSHRLLAMMPCESVPVGGTLRLQQQSLSRSLINRLAFLPFFHPLSSACSLIHSLICSFFQSSIRSVASSFVHFSYSHSSFKMLRALLYLLVLESKGTKKETKEQTKEQPKEQTKEQTKEQREE